MIEDNLKPGRWPVKRSAGDTDVPVTFTLEWDDQPVEVISARAQVRARRDRSSTEIYQRTCVVVDTDKVQVGAGDTIPNTPGRWWWDLQVQGTVGGMPVDLTFLSDQFTILREVTVEGG